MPVNNSTSTNYHKNNMFLNHWHDDSAEKTHSIGDININMYMNSVWLRQRRTYNNDERNLAEVWIQLLEELGEKAGSKWHGVH
ncbi:hypothetical protein MUG91_G89n29 [Manis pentadactyla]|nr:hypothetical protein MUG91_G89n29 [Manis pentadactyla]